MAYTGIIATEDELNAMAGELIDATGWTEANKNLWMAQVEGFLSSLVAYDIATNYGTLNAVSKKILNEYAARYCASCGIAYNMGTVGATFSSLIEPEDMIQFHIYRMEKIEEQLSQGKVLKQIGVS